MTKNFSLLCGCKINIFLQILGKRKDGFHYLESLLYPLSFPADHMDIVEHSGSGLTLRCCPRELEHQGNILHRTYQAFAEATGLRLGLKVYLHKKIPVGAGLGGGSSNAASLLLFLFSRSKGLSLNSKELMSLAGRIGADVPFFIYNQPARVEGIGNEVTPVHLNLKGMHLVLVCPGISINTGWAYQTYDDYCQNSKSLVPPFLTSPETEDNRNTLEPLTLSNCFEGPIFSRYPQLGRIKLDMLKHGAAGCVLSGSGSSLSAFFREKHRASRACFGLERQNISFYYLKIQ